MNMVNSGLKGLSRQAHLHTLLFDQSHRHQTSQLADLSVPFITAVTRPLSLSTAQLYSCCQGQTCGLQVSGLTEQDAYSGDSIFPIFSVSIYFLLRKLARIIFPQHPCKFDDIFVVYFCIKTIREVIHPIFIIYRSWLFITWYRHQRLNNLTDFCKIVRCVGGGGGVDWKTFCAKFH